MNKNRLFHVTLTDEERTQLLTFLKKGDAAGRKFTRAQILLLADETDASDEEIAGVLHVSADTVQRTRKKYVLTGLDGALTDKRHPGAGVKLTPDQERQLTLLACSEAPDGQVRWTLRLLADKLVELAWVDSISHETVRNTLKKTRPSLGCTKPTS